jgi:hypothetical protein
MDNVSVGNTAISKASSNEGYDKYLPASLLQKELEGL